MVYADYVNPEPDDKAQVVKQDEQPEEATPLPPIVLKNGTLKDAVTGHFLPGVRPTSVIASSEQGRAMAVRRHELAKRAARIALADEAGRRGEQRSSVAAVGLLAGRAYAAALDGFQGDLVVNPDGSEYYKVDRRGSVEAGKFAAKLADMLPADERGQAPAVAIQINVSADVEARLRELTADG